MKPIQCVVVACIVAFLCACEQDDASDRQPGSGPQVYVTREDGLKLGGPVASLTVTDANTASATIELSLTTGSSDSERWAAIALPAPEILKTGKASLPLTDKPLARGQASVQRESEDGDAVFAARGMLDVSVIGTRISGTVAGVEDPSLAGHFEGKINILCMVPAAGTEGGSITEVEGGTASPSPVADHAFASPACADLKGGIPTSK